MTIILIRNSKKNIKLIGITYGVIALIFMSLKRLLGLVMGIVLIATIALFDIKTLVYHKYNTNTILFNSPYTEFDNSFNDTITFQKPEYATEFYTILDAHEIPFIGTYFELGDMKYA